MRKNDYFYGIPILKPKTSIIAFWKKYRHDKVTTARAFLWGILIASLTDLQKDIYQSIRELDLTTAMIAEDLDRDIRSVSQALASLERYELVCKIEDNPPLWRAIDYISKE